MFKKYDKEIEVFLSEKKDIPWRKVTLCHKKMIARIQHERLIHLQVTIFVGYVMTLCSLATIVFEKSILLLLDVPLLVLFGAYLLHYRFLENTTQKWYQYEDLLASKSAHIKTKKDFSANIN